MRAAFGLLIALLVAHATSPRLKRRRFRLGRSSLPGGRRQSDRGEGPSRAGAIGARSDAFVPRRGPSAGRRVKTGDQVKEGDVFAVLDAAPYQADLDLATANLQRARAAYANAASQQERDKQLLARGTRQGPIRKQQSAAKQAAAEVKSLEAAQERAKLELGYTELRAPFEGFISAVFSETSEEVKPQQAVMRLIDPSEIEMIVNVPESLIPIAPYVVDLKVTFDAFPGIEIPAELAEVGTEPSETTRTYPVKVLLTPPQGVTILPGMAGRLRGKPGPEIAQRAKGVVIPLSAAYSPDDATGSFVWVVDDAAKTAHRQQVALGEPVVGGVSVTDGLKPGDLVVAVGVHSLQEGQAVRVLEPDGAAAP